VTAQSAFSQRSALLAVLAATLLGFALRVPGLWSDFWLDEIWTWNLAASLDSAGQVFSAIHHSNNHHLNTLIVYWLGEREHWAVYRVVALLAGSACVPLAAAVLWRRGKLAAVLAAWLTAGCFALVHFSSEARGSGPTVACALAALWLFERDLERPRLVTALGFGACVIAGFLFQLVFCFFWAGALVHVGLVLWRRSRDPKTALLGTLRLHALPLLAFALLWLLDLRELGVGGGEPLDAAWFSARLVGSSLGLSSDAALAWPLCLLAAALIAAGLLQLARRNDPLCATLGVTILVAPALVLGWFQPDVLAVRYFLIGIAATLLLCAGLAASALRAGGWRRAAALAALTTFGLGNGLHIARFIEYGRGGYAAALATMAAETRGSRIEVGSDHDFRVGSVLKFHARRLPDPTRLAYLPAADWPSLGPEWLVLQKQQRSRAPDPFVVVRDAHYALVAEYDHAALSGYYWMLYRNTWSGSGGTP
jgi:hypothetical protein